jgi:SAM-dependent methyltransferase
MSDVSRWNDRYQAGDTPWDTGQPSGELARVLAEKAIRPCTAIELGCGTGTNAVWLAQQGFAVTAVDLSPLAIEAAQRRAHDAGVDVHFVVGDVLEPLPDLVGPCDFLFDRGCYHVVRRDGDVQAYMATVRRITKAGSLGLVLTGNAREPHEPGPPVVSAAELRAELGQGFELLQLREFRFDPSERVSFQFLGWSCLIQRPDR